MSTTTRTNDSLWHERLHQAAAFHAEHGRLPKQRENEAGKWLAKQREHLRATRLTPARAQLLAELPGFSTSARAAGHDQHLTAVTDFHAEHGRLPGRKMPGMLKHGQWLHDIRTRKVTPPAQVLAALEQLGFTMTPMEDGRAEFVRRYTEYVQRYGTSWVKARFVCRDGYPLGDRARIRRAHAATGLINREHFDELDALGFPWVSPAGARSAPSSEA